MFEIGTQLWISRSHGYLEVCSKSPKVRDTDISLYMVSLSSDPKRASVLCMYVSLIRQPIGMNKKVN